MTRILPGKGIDINRVADGTLEEWEDNITISKVTVGSVKEVRITHPEMVAQIGDVKYTIPPATKSVNTADVAAFTTYHCYYELVAGVMTFVASTTNPDMSSPEPEYVWLRQIRFKSVANVATIEFVQRQIMCHDEALHSIGDYAYLMPPAFISGFAPTFSLVDGTIDAEAGNYRRMTGDNRTRVAITDGVMYAPVIDTVYANLAEITKYADGSAIAADKFFKVLLGVLVNADSDYDFILNVQGKPSTEYISATEAWSDVERKASTAFSSIRRSAVLPLAWVVMKKGDASTITYFDVREAGLGGGAFGGTTGVTDHGLLTGLTDYADHPGFLLKDGSRALTGNLAADPGVTVDGVDISAHAADASAHHDPVTLAASADALMSLSTQQITLDVQATKKVLAGPVSGADAAPTFRQLAAADISDFDAAALAAAPAVSLAASATSLMDLTGQAISLDNQAASTVLAGPAVGASPASPTFRQLNIQDIARPSGVLTLANGANHNVALTAGVRVYSITGPTGAFSITGFAGGTDGAVLYIYNNVAQNLTISNETGSSAANQIVVTSGASEATTKQGVLMFFYIAGTINRWILAGLVA